MNDQNTIDIIHLLGLLALGSDNADVIATLADRLASAKLSPEVAALFNVELPRCRAKALADLSKAADALASALGTPC